MDAAFETLRALDPGDAGALRAPVSEGAGGFRRRLPVGDPRQGARHAARPAAGGDAVERRHLRHRPGLRGAAAADARAPARRSARLRRRRCSPSCARSSRRSWRASISRSAAAAGASTSPTTRAGARARPRRSSSATSTPEPRDEVTLTDFDPDGEIKVVAAALYAVSRSARRSAARDRAADVGRRARARCCAPTSASAPTAATSPGRAFERTAYRFDVLTDYGAFRDLQRHRLLTLEWQPLSTRHGYIEPEAIEEAGARRRLARVMDASAELLRRAGRRAGWTTPRRTPSRWPTASASTWT